MHVNHFEIHVFAVSFCNVFREAITAKLIDSEITENFKMSLDSI